MLNFSKVSNFGEVFYAIFFQPINFFFIFVPNKFICLLDVSKQDSKNRITQDYHTNKNAVCPLKRHFLFQEFSGFTGKTACFLG
jgi:hypothetical protein